MSDKPFRTPGSRRSGAVHSNGWVCRVSSAGSNVWSRARSPRPSAAGCSPWRSRAGCCGRWTPAARSASAGTVVPNDFTVVLCTEDALRFDDYADVLETELETEAREHARAEGYHFIGPVAVRLVEDPELRRGDLEIESALKEGDGGRVGALVLTDGTRLPLTDGDLLDRAAPGLRPDHRRRAGLATSRRDPARARRLPPRRPRLAQRHHRQRHQGEGAPAGRRRPDRHRGRRDPVRGFVGPNAWIPAPSRSSSTASSRSSTCSCSGWCAPCSRSCGPAASRSRPPTVAEIAPVGRMPRRRAGNAAASDGSS